MEGTETTWGWEKHPYNQGEKGQERRGSRYTFNVQEGAIAMRRGQQAFSYNQPGLCPASGLSLLQPHP